MFRPVGKNNRTLHRALHPESINALIQHAIARAGIDPTGYSAHSLRAGFFTYVELPTAQLRTKPAIKHWPPSAATSVSTTPGPTTLRRVLGYSTKWAAPSMHKRAEGATQMKDSRSRELTPRRKPWSQ